MFITFINFTILVIPLWSNKHRENSSCCIFKWIWTTFLFRAIFPFLRPGTSIYSPLHCICTAHTFLFTAFHRMVFALVCLISVHIYLYFTYVPCGSETERWKSEQMNEQPSIPLIWVGKWTSVANVLFLSVCRNLCVCCTLSSVSILHYIFWNVSVYEYYNNRVLFVLASKYISISFRSMAAESFPSKRGERFLYI